MSKLLTDSDLDKIRDIAQIGRGKFNCQTVRLLVNRIDELTEELNRTGARALLESAMAQSLQQSESSIYERLEKAEAEIKRRDATVPDIDKILETTFCEGESIYWTLVFGMNGDSEEVQGIMAREIVRAILEAAAPSSSVEGDDHAKD